MTIRFEGAHQDFLVLVFGGNPSAEEVQQFMDANSVEAQPFWEILKKYAATKRQSLIPPNNLDFVAVTKELVDLQQSLQTVNFDVQSRDSVNSLLYCQFQLQAFNLQLALLERQIYQKNEPIDETVIDQLILRLNRIFLPTDFKSKLLPYLTELKTLNLQLNNPRQSLSGKISTLKLLLSLTEKKPFPDLLVTVDSRPIREKIDAHAWLDQLRVFGEQLILHETPLYKAGTIIHDAAFSELNRMIEAFPNFIQTELMVYLVQLRAINTRCQNLQATPVPNLKEMDLLSADLATLACKKPYPEILERIDSRTPILATKKIELMKNYSKNFVSNNRLSFFCNTDKKQFIANAAQAVLQSPLSAVEKVRLFHEFAKSDLATYRRHTFGFWTIGKTQASAFFEALANDMTNIGTFSKIHSYRGMEISSPRADC